MTFNLRREGVRSSSAFVGIKVPVTKVSYQGRLRNDRIPHASVILMTCVGFLGCGEDGLPRARVTNETDEEVNISLKQGTDPTMNINVTQYGTTSAFREIQEGDTLVTGLPDKEDGMAFTKMLVTNRLQIPQTKKGLPEVTPWSSWWS